MRVLVDETQFFDADDVVGFVHAFEKSPVQVCFAGLDGDSERRPFASTSAVAALSDDVRHLSALCTRCDRPRSARFTRLRKGCGSGVGGFEVRLYRNDVIEL